jgi:hypothetical protein
LGFSTVELRASSNAGGTTLVTRANVDDEAIIIRAVENSRFLIVFTLSWLAVVNSERNQKQMSG